MQYNKPPPYDRPNWATMNEGQRRYAMEQYNLALVRRGHKFDSPKDEYQEAIDDFDLSLLGGPDKDQGNDSNMADTPPQTPMQTGSGNYASGHTNYQAAKRPLMQSPSGSKRGRTDAPGNSALPGSSGQTDGMGGNGNNGVGGAEGGEQVQSIPMGITNFKHHFTLRKKWKFLSFGVADQIINDVRGAKTRLALTTSMVNVPWEYLFMYASPAEASRIFEFKGAHAIQARIKITQYNPRVAFQTGETSSMTATLNQNKFTRIGIGLRQNSAIICNNRDYIFDTTEPMKPTGMEDLTGQQYRLALHRAMYGVPNNSSIAEHNASIPANATGQELALRQYLTVYASPREDGGFPQYDKFCKEFNAMDCVGQCIVNETYSFNYAPLTPKYPTVFNDPDMYDDQIIDGFHYEVCGTKPDGLITRIHNVATNKTTPQTLFENEATATNNPNSLGLGLTYTFRYDRFPLEQCGLFGEAHKMHAAYKDQQSIHIGVRCVPKLSTNANSIQTESWLDTQMYWTAECELDLASHDTFPGSLLNAFSLPSDLQYQITRRTGTPEQETPIVRSLDPTMIIGKNQCRFYTNTTD